MKVVLIPFLIFIISLSGLVLNPRNNPLLRILVICSSIIFLIMRFGDSGINGMLLLIFLTISAFIGTYYYVLIEKKRS